MFYSFFFILQIFIAALMLSGGFFSLILYFGDKRLKSNLHLANVSFVLVFYSISHLFWFLTPDVQSFILAEKIANFIIITAIYPFMYYLQSYTGYEKNRLFYGTIIFFTSFYFLNFFSEYGLSYSGVEELVPVTPIWGGTIYAPNVKMGFGGLLVITGMCLVFTYIIKSLRHLSKTEPEEVITLFWAFSILIGAVIIDFTLIFLEFSNFLYLQEFTYVIFLFLIAAKSFKVVMTSRSIEHELVSSKLDLKVITEKAGDIIFKVDDNFKITFASPAITKILSYTYSELLGENFKNLIFEDDYALFEQKIEENEGYLICRMLSKDGEARWMSTSVSEIISQNGEILSYILISRDITEQMVYTNELDDKNRLLESIVQSSPYILYTFDFKDFSKIYSYSQIKRYLGYTKQEYDNLAPKPFESIMHPDDANKLPQNILRWTTAEDGEVVFTEYRLRHKNGSYRWFRSGDVVFKRNNKGDVLEVLGAAQDINEHKKMLEELEENERRFKALAEATFEGIIFSEDGVIIDANQQALDMHGFELHEIIGFQLGSNMPEDIQKKIVEKMTSETNSFYQTYSRRRDGTIFPVEIRAKTIIMGSKKVRVSVLRDITSQLEKENELLQAKEEAEKSDRLKSDFLTQISHEIRSPIHTILSFAGYIRDQLNGKVEEDIIESLDSMDTAGRRITRTIDLILNMSQINTGTFEIEKRFVPIMEDVIAPILKEYDLLAKENGNKLEVHCGNCPMDIQAYVDEYALKQIMQNLVDNAIKFTKNGTISISGEKVDGRLHIHIEDTGIGISAEYLPHLFSSFSQEEQGYTRRFDGNGLGLALVKKYCEINNIDITVKSKKGKGSTFTLVFNEEVK